MNKNNWIGNSVVQAFLPERFLLAALCLLLSGATLFAQEPARGPGDMLSLRQAVALAVQNSRELALARIRYTVADKTTGVTRAQFLPNLYTGSGAAYTKGFPQTPGGGPPTVFNLSFVQTVLNMPLRGQLRAAEERAQIQKLNIDRVQDSVILNTASAYLELAKVRHSLKLLRAERASSQRIVELTRERAGEGLELSIEVTRAQLSAARVEQRIVQNESREDALESQLRATLGLPMDRHIEISEEQFPQWPAQPVGELVEQALANHPDLKEAEMERRAREHRLKGERGGYWPTMDLVSFFGVYSKRNNFNDFFTSFERTSVSLGVRVRIPIFSASTSAAVGLARADLSAAELELKNKRVDLEMTVRQEARHERELDAAREVARLELQLAQENIRGLQAQLQEGRVSLRDLEKARLEESDKWLQFLDAEYQRQKSQLELLRMTGQLARALQ